jgi:putative endopeptidase
MKKTILLLFVLMTGYVYSQDYFLKENIDYNVNPTEDFFMFANGNFIKAHPIPPEEHTYGIFNLVEDSVYVYLQRICESAMNDKSAVQGSNIQRIGDFYASGLDVQKIESNKLMPIKKYFDKIDNIKDKTDLIKVVTEMQKSSVSPMFSFYVGQDLMNSEKYSVYIGQGGIGLPERDYYFNNDERNKNIRAEYKKHLGKMLELILPKSDSKVPQTVYNIEYDLAKSSRKLEDLRDDYANYNKKSMKELSKLTPSIDWNKMFVSFGLNNINEVIVGQPEFFEALEKTLDKYSIDDWKNYLKWNVLNATATLLSDDIEKINFDFYGKVLSGTTEQRPRWKRVLDNTNELLGEILGMEYVRIYFPPEDKVRTKEIVNNMVDAFAERIRKLDWMSEPTKQMALKKLGTMVKKIGYPDVWKDYSTLSISRDSYVDNVLNARRWQFNDMISKYGKPVDRTEWHMNPQTYNAYYNPSNNEIVIPAAILTVPGKKMSEVDDAFLYGFIGASTIGHEMTHGFDDQGRLYDEFGNLKGWWTAEDSIKFVKKSQLMIDQFSGYVVLDSMHVNGKATLGENIADLGGLVIGIEALMNSEEGKSNKEIGGFNSLQRYFLGYAYSWAVYYRPETLARRIMTDVHSPAFLRVNGPYSNIKEFYEAFNVKDGNKLFRNENVRVQIW